MTIAADARLSDAQRTAKQDEVDKRNREIALLKKDLNDTFATGSGRRTLRFLMDMCGYQRPSIIADPQSGNPLIDGTIYNEARRNLYLSIRKYIHKDILTAVENEGLEQDQQDIFS